MVIPGCVVCTLSEIPSDSASVELSGDSLKARPGKDALKWPLNPNVSTASRDESKESDDVSDASIDPLPRFQHPHLIPNQPLPVIDAFNQGIPPPMMGNGNYAFDFGHDMLPGAWTFLFTFTRGCSTIC